MARVDFREIEDIAWTWNEEFDETQPVILPLNTVLENVDALEGRNLPLGVVIRAGENVEDLAPVLDRLSLIALDFPAYTDGRAYSSARVLREHLGFQGEIRAVGDVLVDQLRFMLRCGFSSAELAPHVKEDAVLRALSRYSGAYQAASDDLAPAHRLRRLSALQEKEVA
ncbi:MAG: DUF934 domain-containing protein [Sphingomonadales bacterium]|jgi:uncharacterized protein (DUF934 family)